MFKLRDYQQTCVGNVMQDLMVNKHKKVGIIAPTGAGKTEIFVQIAKEYLIENPDKYVLILSHLSLLTTQTYLRIRKRTPDIFTGILQASRLPDERAKVVVSTMQSSRNEEKLDLWLTNGDLFGSSVEKKDVGLVIVDECHFLMTTSYDKILDGLLPAAQIVGCTATPYRSAKIMLDYFDKVSFTISLDELIEKGYLVPPQLKQIAMDDDTLEGRMNTVASAYCEYEKGKPAVVFMRTIDDAKTMRNVFIQRGVRAKTITCDETDDVRDNIIEGMKQGLVDVITTVNVLSAGVDIPNLEVIMMPYPTKSPTLFIQRVGRALRPYENKTEARIYVVGTPPEIQSGLYERILKKTLVDGTPQGSDLRDELELMELIEATSTEDYVWTKRMVTFADKFEALGASKLGKLIVKKNFPKRFLDHADTLMELLPDDVNYVGHRVNARQKRILNVAGFNMDQIGEMTYADAETMITLVQDFRVKMSGDNKWLLPSGKYLGKHVKDVPYGYRNAVMKSKNEVIRTSVPAKMLRKWWWRKERT